MCDCFHTFVSLELTTIAVYTSLFLAIIIRHITRIFTLKDDKNRSLDEMEVCTLEWKYNQVGDF